MENEFQSRNIPEPKSTEQLNGSFDAMQCPSVLVSIVDNSSNITSKPHTRHDCPVYHIKRTSVIPN